MKIARTIAASVTGALVVGGVVLEAPSAMAAPANCRSGLGCTFENANYGGGRINFSNNVYDFTDIWKWGGSLHTWTNDAASSGFNNGVSGQVVYWFKNAAYKGAAKSATKGHGVTHFGDLNDQISSACFAAACK